MVVDRKNDNENNSSISKPKEESVDIYENDNNKTIISTNNLIYGRFPTDFLPLIRLQPNDKCMIRLLFNHYYIHHPEND